MRFSLGPVQSSERALAPDLVRGAMLLFIALANSAVFTFRGQPGIERLPDGVERWFNLFMLVFVDARAYPVFAVMFGYGMVQLWTRQSERGVEERTVRRILLRRNTWLVVFGLAHAALLNFGDFLAAYGIVGIVSTLLLVSAGPRVQRLVIWIWAAAAIWVIVLAVLCGLAASVPLTTPATVPMAPLASLSATSYVQAIGFRLAEWPLHTASVLPFIIIVWLGIWAGHRRLIEDAAQHRALLLRTASVCLGITFAGGLPIGLVGAGLLRLDASAEVPLVVLQQASGMFGGPGYVALFALLANALGLKAPLVRPVAALGRRSLSGYLLQSVAWVALLSPLGADIAARSSSPGLWTAMIALAVWTATAALALAMDLAGIPGPFERLLRRLTHGNVPRPEPADIGGESAAHEPVSVGISTCFPVAPQVDVGSAHP